MAFIYSQTFHFRLSESHFSGVVIIMLYFEVFKSKSSSSPVADPHNTPNGSNFFFQSAVISLHRAFIGATEN